MVESNRRTASMSKKPRGNASLIESLEPRQLMSANTSDITTPTAWHWYQGISASSLASKASANNERIVDLQVQTASPLTFTAALVKNTGAYASGWYWYYGQTLAQVGTDVTTNHARIVSLDPYVVNGSVFYATLLVPNTGSTAKSWWYYVGETQASIATHIRANNGRLIDLESYVVGGKTYYADVMISNTGADAKNWHYYFNESPSAISSLLTSNASRLVDMNPDAAGKFDVIMQKNDGVQWFYYYGLNSTSLNNLASQDGARIFDVDSYVSGGTRVFSAVMVNNSNALETTVGNLLRSIKAPNTVSGAYLKNVDGSVIADVNGERQFEPASAIKVVAAVTAMLAVKAGTAHLTDSIAYYYKPGDSTNKDVNPDSFAHTNSNKVTTTLQDAITRMMENSDNRTTLAIELRFGLAKLNSVAQSLGMTSTIWTQTVGNGVPGNYLTLHDASLIWDKIVDGTLLGTTLTGKLENMILNQSNYAVPFVSVIQQEAAKVLGLSINNAKSVALANKFAAAELWGAKGGSYSLGIDANTYSLISTGAAYLELPVKSATGAMSYRKYSYGVFVDYATVPVVPKGVDNPPVDQLSAAKTAASNELVRGIINSALQTWV